MWKSLGSGTFQNWDSAGQAMLPGKPESRDTYFGDSPGDGKPENWTIHKRQCNWVCRPTAQNSAVAWRIRRATAIFLTFNKKIKLMFKNLKKNWKGSYFLKKLKKIFRNYHGPLAAQHKGHRIFTAFNKKSQNCEKVESMAF